MDLIRQFRSLVLICLVTGTYASGFGQNAGTDSLLKAISNEVTAINRQLSPNKEPGKGSRPLKPLPVVTGMGSMLKARPDSTAVFGDYLYLQVSDIDAMIAYRDSLKKATCDSSAGIILYLNGNPMRDIGVMNIDRNKNRIVFHLSRHSKYLMKFYPDFNYLWSAIPITVTAGFRNGTVLSIDPRMGTFMLKYVGNWALVFALIMIITIIASFVILAARTNLIRIGNIESAFSLALTQLSFWTIVVAASFIYIWIATEEVCSISGSTLILLSISVATTAGAKLIDIREGMTGDPNLPSRGFFEDILSDELGYSVHRCQMFLWTAILGVIFITNVITKQEMPQLDESLLALMGISSGAYVGLKTVENKKSAKKPKKVQGVHS